MKKLFHLLSWIFLIAAVLLLLHGLASGIAFFLTGSIWNPMGLSADRACVGIGLIIPFVALAFICWDQAESG